MYESPSIVSMHVDMADYLEYDMKFCAVLSCGHKRSFTWHYRKTPAFLDCPVCTEDARRDAYYQNI